VQADPQRRASFVVHSAIASFYHKSFPALGSASQGVMSLRGKIYCQRQREVKMQRYIDEIKKLKKETGQYLAERFDTESDDSVENIKIKTEALEIIKKAYESETTEKYSKIKSLVIEYLCEICGCAEDLEILENNSPAVISDKEIEYIIQNSALSRWF